MSAEFVIPDWMTPADGPSPPPQAPVDDHRVEDLVNRFIAAKQDALFTAPDAYYRSEGRDAVDAAPAILDRLNAQRDGTLDQADDDRLRTILGQRLDLHLTDASDGIDRHAAAQREAFNRQVISERQSLIQRAATLEHTNDDKLAGLAEAHASAAQELARMNGQPEGPAIDAARSTIWRTVIDHRLANSNGPQALDLFDRVKDQLTPADHRSLDSPIQAAALDHAADQWIDRESAAPGEPLATRLQADPDLSPAEKAVVRLKLEARASVEESDRAATVKGLDDRLAATSQALTTAPAAYRRGALAAIVKAYEDAGATDSATALGRVAAHEPLLLPFAQLGADRQRLALDALPEEARPAAEAIGREQARAFAKDPFTAGTALYADVGAPVPVEDIAGRIGQARKIAERRGTPVAPFTGDEITGIRRTLVEGSPGERQALFTQIDALPYDMKAALAPLLAPPAARETASDIPSDDSALHRDGVQLAQADAEPAAPSEKADGDEQGTGRTFRFGFDDFVREYQKEQERAAAEEAAAANAGRQGPCDRPRSRQPRIPGRRRGSAPHRGRAGTAAATARVCRRTAQT